RFSRDWSSDVCSSDLIGFVFRELLDAGLMHGDVETVLPGGMRAWCEEPTLAGGTLGFVPAPTASGDEDVVRPASAPFEAQGGLQIGRASWRERGKEWV